MPSDGFSPFRFSWIRAGLESIFHLKAVEMDAAGALGAGMQARPDASGWPWGAVAGMAGSFASGIYLSFICWWIGYGFWLPWNLAAAIFGGFRPAGPGLAPATAVGLAVILVFAALLGLAMGRLGIGLVRGVPMGFTLMFGFAWGTAAWVLSGIAARALGSPLGSVLPFHYLAGHLLGGLLAAVSLRRILRG
jgi:hypothetical protein